MNELNNIDATVFVFRSKPTGSVLTCYAPEFNLRHSDPELEHVATLEPRLWIQANWHHVGSVQAERKRCAELAAPERFVYSDDEWRVRCEIRDAINEPQLDDINVADSLTN